MSDMTDLAAAASAIANPATSAADLAVIAEAHPSLRTAVALHPNAYPGLLDWLDALGDPTLSRAVAARRSADAKKTEAPSAPPPPFAPSAPQPAMGYGTNVAPPPTSQFAGLRTILSPAQMPLIVAVLFFVGAFMAVIDLAVYSFDACYAASGNVAVFPLGWVEGFNNVCRTGDASAFATVFSIVGVLALAGCGAASLVIGKKDLNQSNFLIGVVLTCVTAISTIVAIVGAIQVASYSYYGGVQWFSIISSLVSAAVPVVFLLMVKSPSQQRLDQMRTIFLIATGAAVVLSGLSVAGVFGLFLGNLGNIPVFAALLFVAFVSPNVGLQQAMVPQRDMKFFIASAMAVAGGGGIVLSIFSYTLYGNYPYRPVGYTIALICGAYMIVAGVLGFKSMADRSKAQLLLVLGIGLAVAQGGWLAMSTYLDNKFLYILGFLAVAALYILSAVNLGKGTSMSLGQAGMGQPYDPGQSNIPGQPYDPGQPNIAAQPYPSGSAVAQPYAGQPYPQPNGVYDAPSGGFAVLGFFIPVVGLILYLVWKDQTPLRAKSAGKGALIGVIVEAGITILYFIVIAVLIGALGSM